ncbi:MAG: ArsR/SmtB family transcription factor [Candidatus Dormibacteria bacterium]
MRTASRAPSPGPAAARIKGCCQALAPCAAPAVVDRVATMLRALADPTRLQMLHMLARAHDPVCVCDFTAAFQLGQPTVSHHLAKLRDAGLVTSNRQGIWAFYALAPDLPAVVRTVVDELAAAAA